MHILHKILTFHLECGSEDRTGCSMKGVPKSNFSEELREIVFIIHPRVLVICCHLPCTQVVADSRTKFGYINLAR